LNKHVGGLEVLIENFKFLDCPSLLLKGGRALRVEMSFPRGTKRSAWGTLGTEDNGVVEGVVVSHRVERKRVRRVDGINDVEAT
jgi:hypothetical protein